MKPVIAPAAITDPGDSAHAELGPSSAHRWLSCPASLRLSRQVEPRPSGDAAAAGTVLHAELERVLRGGEPSLSAAAILELDVYNFNPARAQSILDKAVHSIQFLWKDLDIGTAWLEHRVHPGRLIGRDDIWGTADCYAISRCQSVLLVADFKSGRIKVDPKFNDQMLLYAAGAMHALGDARLCIKEVVLAVVQPSVYPAGFARWECSADLIGEFMQFVAERASEFDSADSAPNPSPDACAWCAAAAICPARAISSD